MNLLHNHQINQVFRAFSEPVRFLGPFLVGAVCLDMEYGSAVYLDAVLLVILEGVLLVDMEEVVLVHFQEAGILAVFLSRWGSGHSLRWPSCVMAQQESVQAVELPTLTEPSESEIGPLIAGDWLTTIGSFLRDISSSSWMWWDEVLQVAGALYRVWLNSEPMERLRLTPVTPRPFNDLHG